MSTDRAAASWSRIIDVEQTVLFMHIPKTAGTSLRASLATLYDVSERLYAYDSNDMDGAVHPKDFERLPASRRAGLRFVMGHFYYGIHEHIPRPSRYVTMLREPVDRVASIYFHYKSNAAPRSGSRGYEEQLLIAESGLSLEAWAFDGQRREADNGMVRAISDRSGVAFGHCPDDMLTEALEHIEAHFEAVLIRGLMPQSVEILQRIVGATLPRVGFENANAARQPLAELEPTTTARLRELNRLDAELFRISAQRFADTYDRITA